MMTKLVLAWLDALYRKVRRRGIFGVLRSDPHDTFPHRLSEAEAVRVEEILARRELRELARLGDELLDEFPPLNPKP